jgi:hypothetical protein
MLNLSKFFRKKSLGPRSIWDTLYDLYLDFEYRCITPWWHRSGDEGNSEIFFPESKYDPIKLKKIEECLGLKCEDYFHFLEFYNGLNVGQWHILSCEDIDKMIPVSIKEFNKLPIMFWDIDYRGNTEVAEDDAMAPEICYIAKAGNILVYVRDEPALISNSFEEFMSECVFGPRYLEFGEEDATYRFLQRFIKEKDEEQTKFFKKFGKHSDEDENPARDPRIMTGYRKAKLDMAQQTYEQTKDLPAGTPIHFK